MIFAAISAAWIEALVGLAVGVLTVTVPVVVSRRQTRRTAEQKAKNQEADRKEAADKRAETIIELTHRTADVVFGHDPIYVDGHLVAARQVGAVDILQQMSKSIEINQASAQAHQEADLATFARHMAELKTLSGRVDKLEGKQ